ncbi:MAG TPA: RNA polymerase subunit sigma-70 [Bacteroidales bacterium]|nr:MAG: hypothetical protein A2W98_11800 [Bacteroidetes bacterium GWF2_33_38]OFY76381.1 MAG: hypothetical protein A2265_02085 [Bacteroidetes bacterium RIFOXYA12_FULL_33_9]OFY88449.1 MAG: hypothetical protein A2236_03525 [Bacteroidetes bacterium RIFOXYA2_FULL_33_7]HBF89432.1 RNA polymerase subunit sigma-70 [Bacteroidales bacterium]
MIFGKKHKAKNLSDEEILQKFKDSGDNIFMEIIYERYYHLIYGLCVKYLKDRCESQDSVIHIFEKILIEVKKIEILNFNSWVYTVSRNYCLMKIRTEKRQRDREQIFCDENFELEISIENDVEEHKKENVKKLEQIIAELNIEQQECIKMFYLEEMTYNQISVKTGFSKNSVKSYIQNGKRNIINQFKK